MKCMRGHYPSGISAYDSVVYWYYREYIYSMLDIYIYIYIYIYTFIYMQIYCLYNKRIIIYVYIFILYKCRIQFEQWFLTLRTVISAK